MLSAHTTQTVILHAIGQECGCSALLQTNDWSIPASLEANSLQQVAVQHCLLILYNIYMTSSWQLSTSQRKLAAMVMRKPPHNALHRHHLNQPSATQSSLPQHASHNASVLTRNSCWSSITKCWEQILSERCTVKIG